MLLKLPAQWDVNPVKSAVSQLVLVGCFGAMEMVSNYMSESGM